MASLYEEVEVEEKAPHPFDAVFGEKINSNIQENTGGQTIGLTFAEFKDIQWPQVFPYFICDLIEAITGFSMNTELQYKSSKKFDEDRNARIKSKIRMEKEKTTTSGIKVNEKQLQDKFETELLTEKEKNLKELKIKVTPSVYEQLWRFFSFMRYNVNESNQSRCYMTE